MKDKTFVILWGGKGRSKTISHLVDNGFCIGAVIAPRAKRVDLEAEAEVLNQSGVEVHFLSNQEVESYAPLKGSVMLCLGYPFILTARVLGKFSMCLNVHPTLLPDYRGPHAGFYVIAEGQKNTGATLHFMNEEMDAGPIIHQIQVELTSFDTVRSMQSKVYAIEPELVTEGLALLGSDKFRPRPQLEGEGSVYPNLRTPEDSRLDDQLSLKALYNFIRACDPEKYPAYFEVQGEKVFIRLWTERDKEWKEEV